MNTAEAKAAFDRACEEEKVCHQAHKEARQKQAFQTYICLLTGIKPGEVLRLTKYKIWDKERTHPGEVSEWLVEKWCSTRRFEGRRRLKNGGWHKCVHSVFLNKVDIIEKVEV